MKSYISLTSIYILFIFYLYISSIPGIEINKRKRRLIKIMKRKRNKFVFLVILSLIILLLMITIGVIHCFTINDNNTTINTSNNYILSEIVKKSPSPSEILTVPKFVTINVPCTEKYRSIVLSCMKDAINSAKIIKNKDNYIDIVNKNANQSYSKSEKEETNEKEKFHREIVCCQNWNKVTCIRSILDIEECEPIRNQLEQYYAEQWAIAYNAYNDNDNNNNKTDRIDCSHERVDQCSGQESRIIIMNIKSTLILMIF